MDTYNNDEKLKSFDPREGAEAQLDQIPKGEWNLRTVVTKTREGVRSARIIC